jgi:uncharacterized membrane protein YjgN (DUF898 family)
MSKKFEIKESHEDFWGNKKYTVTEKKEESSYGILFFIVALFALPSGVVFVITYLIYPLIFSANTDDKEKRDEWMMKRIKNSFYFSVLICLLYYLVFFNLDTDLLMLIGLSVAGLVCYLIFLFAIAASDD